MNVVEPENPKPDESRIVAGDQGKVKPEAKQDSTKKSKSKASAARETLSGFPDSEQDEVETIPVFKKS